MWFAGQAKALDQRVDGGDYDEGQDGRLEMGLMDYQAGLFLR